MTKTPPLLAEPTIAPPPTPTPTQHDINALPSIVGHGMTATKLLSRRSVGMFANMLTTAQLPHLLMNPQTWGQIADMQAAVGKRLQQQTRDWINGCAVLVQDYDRIKQATTMSKLAERQFNFIAQCGQLLSDQTTSLIELQENIEVNYNFWASQQLPQVVRAQSAQD